MFFHEFSVTDQPLAPTRHSVVESEFSLEVSRYRYYEAQVGRCFDFSTNTCWQLRQSKIRSPIDIHMNTATKLLHLYVAMYSPLHFCYLLGHCCISCHLWGQFVWVNRRVPGIYPVPNTKVTGIREIPKRESSTHSNCQMTQFGSIDLHYKPRASKLVRCWWPSKSDWWTNELLNRCLPSSSIFIGMVWRLPIPWHFE